MPESLHDSQVEQLEFSGNFETWVNGSCYGLELHRFSDKILLGKLLIRGQPFDIKAYLMVRVEGAYGFLLEPLSNYPMALLRASFVAQNLILDVDFPDFASSADRKDLWQLTFERTKSDKVS